MSEKPPNPRLQADRLSPIAHTYPKTLTALAHIATCLNRLPLKRNPLESKHRLAVMWYTCFAESEGRFYLPTKSRYLPNTLLSARQAKVDGGSLFWRQNDERRKEVVLRIASRKSEGILRVKSRKSEGLQQGVLQIAS